MFTLRIIFSFEFLAAFGVCTAALMNLHSPNLHHRASGSHSFTSYADVSLLSSAFTPRPSTHDAMD